jgi:hypothetical protein
MWIFTLPILDCLGTLHDNRDMIFIRHLEPPN